MTDKVIDADSYILHSSEIKDDFTITIRQPENFSKNKNYHLIYVADGSIGLGQYLLGKDTTWKAMIPENCIVITIGHNGNWQEKRRRDFIPSDAGGYRDEKFGNANKFYSFLKNEIIPSVKKKFPSPQSTAFIGHSFSGLFCLYAALQNEDLFNRYYAISPSVWTNHYELLKIEEDFSKNATDLKAEIHIYVGGLEVFNKVLSSSKKFYTSIKNRGYKNVVISFEKIPFANHNSVRKPAVDRILTAYQH